MASFFFTTLERSGLCTECASMWRFVQFGRYEVETTAIFPLAL